jgi:hypothetical protein
LGGRQWARNKATAFVDPIREDHLVLNAIVPSARLSLRPRSDTGTIYLRLSKMKIGLFTTKTSRWNFLDALQQPRCERAATRSLVRFRVVAKPHSVTS